MSSSDDFIPDHIILRPTPQPFDGAYNKSFLLAAIEKHADLEINDTTENEPTLTTGISNLTRHKSTDKKGKGFKSPGRL